MIEAILSTLPVLAAGAANGAEAAEHHVHDMLLTMTVALSGGVFLIAVSRAIKVSAIVLLLIGGFMLGPEVFNVVRPESLGDGLRVIVSLAVGLILFEGGLTLDLSGYKSASKVIQRLLTIGLLVTWLATAGAIWLIFGHDIRLCLLAASLVIVTGPTVIAPLLKRIKVKHNVHNILHWEGVLIDPLGVFVALLCYEVVAGQALGHAIGSFALRLAGGFVIGVAGGLTIYYFLKKRFVPEDMMNVFALASAILIFELTEIVATEAGLLSVTVAGFVLGWKRPVELKQIKDFKAELTDLMIGMLFVLLAARLELAQFQAFGLRGVLLVAAIMLLIRPLNVFLSSAGLGMNWREKTFLSWVAPRGIVAASMASFITLRLSQGEFENAQFIETFTYSVIMATVLIQGFSAGPVASLLKLKRAAPTGWVIIGAHPLGRSLARFVSRGKDTSVLVIDSNPKAVADAKEEGIQAMLADARDASLEEREEMQGIGNLLALTDNEELNELLCQRWQPAFGRDHVFRWSGAVNKERTTIEHGNVIWSKLPKPSLLSAELSRGEASVHHSDDTEADPGNLTTLIAAKRGKNLFFDPKTINDQEDLEGYLYLKREADYLLRSLKPELVMRLEASSISELFEQTIDRVVNAVPRLPRDETLKELQEREQSFPTALGHGIAVPHAYSPALESRVCAIAQVPNGVDFNAPDGEPVELAFLLLSPTGDPEGHLATMAEIARLVSDKPTRERLLAAEDPADMLMTIHSFNPTGR